MAGTTPAAVRRAIDRHRAAGRPIAAGGVRSFVREDGEGEPVLCLHGVPTSSYLYRKVAPELAARGLRAVAIDFPGLGLADRPPGFDYSWSGLAAWSGAAIDALELDRCHLVVHDIGGPIGLEWAVRNPERVLSLTVLDTLLNVASFRRPWTMRPFAVPRLGELYLRTMTRTAMVELFYLQGIEHRATVPRAEVGAYYDLLLGDDAGAAFLQIMRGFELTEAKQDLLWSGLARRPYPARVVWGRNDPALGAKHCRIACDVLGLDQPTLLDARHFPQEDRAPQLAQLIAELAHDPSRDR